MRYQFCRDVEIAVNAKNAKDATFARLCTDMCAGNVPYSKSAILSAMENCDDAMEALWIEVGRVMHQDSSLVQIGDATLLQGLISSVENLRRLRVERISSIKTHELAAD